MPSKQQIVNSLLILLLVGGALLTIALLLGIANPPRASEAVISVQQPDQLDEAGIHGNMRLLRAGRLPVPPYTMEAQAFSNRSDAEWGLWLGDSASPCYLLIDNQGYYSVGADQWRPFLHLRTGSNRIYFHVDQTGNGTLRLNGEIAWQGSVDYISGADWGLAIRTSAALSGLHLTLRAG